MKVELCKEPIVCDIAGCGSIAKYYLKASEKTCNGDSLKLCTKCAEGMYKLFKTMAEVKVSGKNKQ